MRNQWKRKDGVRFRVAYEIINNHLMPKQVASKLRMNVRTVEYYWATAQRIIRGQPIRP